MKTSELSRSKRPTRPRQAAAYLKVSERQIRNFIARKLLRKSKAQQRRSSPARDVETLLARTS